MTRIVNKLLSLLLVLVLVFGNVVVATAEGPLPETEQSEDDQMVIDVTQTADESEDQFSEAEAEPIEEPATESTETSVVEPAATPIESQTAEPEIPMEKPVVDPVVETSEPSIAEPTPEVFPEEILTVDYGIEEASMDSATTGSCGSDAIWTLQGTTLVISGKGSMESYMLAGTAPWSNWADTINTIIVQKGITSIGLGAFVDMTSVTTVTLSEGVTTIGSYAFSGCTGLTTIYVPESLTRVLNGAFDGCNHFSIYYAGDEEQFNQILYDARDVGNSPFNHASVYFANIDWIPGKDEESTSPKDDNIIAQGSDGALNWVLDKDGLLTISGTGAMRDYTGTNNGTRSPWYGKTDIKAVSIQGITHIGDCAFSYCKNLREVSMPSVVSIGRFAFEACDIQTLSMPSVTSIGAYAFYRNSYLETVTMPNVITIGDSAFRMCYKVNIVLPDTVTFIGGYAFEFCVFSNITIPNSVTSINERTFKDCVNLSSITIPNSATSIGAYAFENCNSLTEITIPDSVTSIGMGAFWGCEQIKTIVLGSGIHHIDSEAFRYCLLSDVYYSGSESQWNQIAIDPTGNGSLLNATIHFNSTGPDKPSVQTNGLKLGVLQSVNMAKDTVTVDGKEYLVYSNFMDSMNDLLKNKKISDKRVVLEMLEGVVVSVYSIYDLLECYISINVVTNPAELVYQDGQYNTEQFSMDVSFFVTARNDKNYFIEADNFDLDKLNITLTVDRIQLEVLSSPKYFYFGKTLFIKDHKKTFTFDPVTVTFDKYAKKFKGRITIEGINIDTGVEPEEQEINANIRGTLGFVDVDIDELGDKASWQSLEIPIINKDFTKQQEEKIEKEQKEYEVKLTNTLTDTRALALSTDLEQYLMECGYKKADINLATRTIEQALIVYLAEVGSTTHIEYCPDSWIEKLGKFLEDNIVKALKNVKNGIKSKVLSKLGLNMAEIPNGTTVTLTPEVLIGKDILVQFNIKVQIYSFGDETFGDFADIHYTIDGTRRTGTGMYTSTSMEKFADLMMDYLKIAYNKAWGTNADKIASAIIEKPYSLLLFGKGTFSGKMFKIPLEGAKKNVKRTKTKCPVDVYVYKSNGALSAQIVNNSVVCNDDNLTCLVDGDAKIVYYTGGDYSIKLVGTGTGTMEQTVEEFTEGNLVRTVTTKNIPLSVGKTYTGSIPASLYVNNETYALKDDQGKTIKVDDDTLSPQKPATAHYTVTIENASVGYNAQLKLDNGKPLTEGTGHVYYVWMFKDANDRAYNSFGIAPIKGNSESTSVYIGKMGGNGVRVTGVEVYVVTDTNLYGDLFVDDADCFGYGYKGM